MAGVGANVGCDVGLDVGLAVGAFVACSGNAVGFAVGAEVGLSVGGVVGVDVACTASSVTANGVNAIVPVVSKPEICCTSATIAAPIVASPASIVLLMPDASRVAVGVITTSTATEPALSKTSTFSIGTPALPET